MIKQALNIRLGQSLSMTPQLQQAIRLLQLSSIEIEQEIQTALDENPLLERSENNNEQTESVLSEHNPTGNDNNNDNSQSSLDQDIPDNLPMDVQWDEIYDTGPRLSADSSSQSLSDFVESRDNSVETIREHLLWQVNLSSLNAQDRIIAEILINNINDDGYLTESTENIYHLLADELMIELDDIESVLKYIQHLEPTASGARNLSECLMIQLNLLPKDTPELVVAKELVQKKLDILENRNYTKLRRLYKLNQKELETMLHLLQTLNPKPGSLFGSETIEYITPDVYVKKVKPERGREKKDEMQIGYYSQQDLSSFTKRQGSSWVVSLNGESTPKLHINQFYADLLNRKDINGSATYLKQNLQQARWLIKSLENRNSTILQVSKIIMKRQRAFLKHGDTAIKPMIMRDVADELGMHESTVSRATTRKYLHTPRGIYELKHFFSSHVGTVAGGKCSSTAIRALIKNLISEENSKKPLSDDKLSVLLKQQGINIARRTVAKYRESMAIPSSRRRKCLG